MKMNKLKEWFYVQIILRIEARANGVSYGWLRTVYRLRKNFPK
jgi:hypothetical protein